MMEHVGFAVSAGAAHVLTNLDNLALLTGMMLTLGAPRAVAGFVLSQVIVLTVSMAVAVGADQGFTQYAGYLGVVPLVLGLRGILQQFRAPTQSHATSTLSQSSLLGATALFLSLSMDSLAVMAPLLADSLPAYRISAVLGAGLAVVGLGGLGILLSRIATTFSAVPTRLETLGPYAMVAVGIYVLLNSGTDVL
ncbi:hypothetical protein FAP39_10290 [Shimia litoralis]|uniref:Uncharacterized protein n=1 Tax=Shimia litoralis TaxID=420403 RepID=A0A4U7N7T8_9RHOB|nr:hypothetical protein [Shimia litoralis]TKZ20664.1 hypothetical protein FAP39_10290 [Shimia litoralis]